MSCPGTGTLCVALVTPCLAEIVRFRLQQAVQGIFHALPNDFRYMLFELTLVDLNDSSFLFPKSLLLSMKWLLFFGWVRLATKL